MHSIRIICSPSKTNSTEQCIFFCSRLHWIFLFLYVIHRHCNKFLSLALICLRTVEYPSKEFKSRVMRFHTYYRATHIFTQLFGMKKLKQWDKLSHCPFEWLYPWVWVRASWRRPLLTLVLCVSFEIQIVSGD